MQRWNSWGEAGHDYPLPEHALHYLADLIGPGYPLEEVLLETVSTKVAESRLANHSLVNKDPEVRVCYARGHSFADWLAKKSGQFETVPDGVAFPESRDDILQLLEWAEQMDCNLIPYGGGTSVVGHINPQAGARPTLTVSMSRLSQLLALDKESLLATFGAGTTGPQVEAQLQAHGFTLGHFPQSFEYSTLGGWVATRSSGQQSLGYGRIETLFAGGRLETFQGSYYLRPFPAESAGPDLKECVLGSEGRLGILSEVIVNISRLPRFEAFYGLFFPDWQAGIAACQQALQQRIPLSMLRLSAPEETETFLRLSDKQNAIRWLEKLLVMRGAKAGRCQLLVGVSGEKAQCHHAWKQLRRISRFYGGVNTGQLIGQQWQRHRYRNPYLRETLWQAGYGVDTVETATQWLHIDSLRQAMEQALRSALHDAAEQVHVFTHISHCYAQGASLYTTFVFRLGETYDITLARWQKLKAAVMQAIVTHGGTVSHHHGVGVDHRTFLPSTKDEQQLKAISALCQHFDPNARLCAHNLLPPNFDTLLTATGPTASGDLSHVLKDTTDVVA
ncbi:FAD-binding oxidoreductase [Zooshikella marina]|uniref:FAD-binding oxidoreductase n=1 Tax=Zooshikella ganghwensis TaxID=202772 RepID=UPI001BB0BA83|nr:FAD-binding oxidoreductase [Zooshikella ganghwensis]MBU2704363.1 FAD-binding oxidoreductase [Zooshikella ganghwensis]